MRNRAVVMFVILVVAALLAGSAGGASAAWPGAAGVPGGGGREANPRSGPGSGAAIPAQDLVFSDDLIVKGAMCVGVTCVEDEAFGFESIKIKSDNPRFIFDDTSPGENETKNDWQITVNDYYPNNPSYFAIEDLTAGRQPFKVLAGAPADALYVGANGNLGLGTNTPQKDIHIISINEPSIRFEQISGSGYTPQTWDLLANETYLSIKDVTNNLTPFYLQPGSPQASLVLYQGKVGLGVRYPSTDLQLYRNAADKPVIFRIENAAPHKQWNFVLQADGRLNIAQDTAATAKPELILDEGGNLFLSGALSQGSDANSKHAFAAVDPSVVLDKLANLPVSTWSYKSDAPQVRHLGPTAQDFYAAFGLGADDTHISPLDASSVAIVAVQRLNQQVSELKAQNAELERRLAALEAQPSGKNSLLPTVLLALGLVIAATIIAVGFVVSALLKRRVV